jgi:nitroreductase
MVVERRRSACHFSLRSISRSDLASVLAAVTSTVPGDAFTPDPVSPFLIVNAVDGVEPGLYRADLSPIRIGDFRRLAGALALGQELGAEAAVDIYLLAHLDAILDRLGERGYRVAQMAGGIAGGRVDLAATALGLGSTGLTFFDDEVTRSLEPAAQGRQVMYLVAIGHQVDHPIRHGPTPGLIAAPATSIRAHAAWTTPPLITLPSCSPFDLRGHCPGRRPMSASSKAAGSPSPTLRDEPDVGTGEAPRGMPRGAGARLTRRTRVRR